jgi:hypothetical protein
MSYLLDSTVGGSAANAYCTVAEAQAYFDSRMSLTLPGWLAPPAGQDVMIGMATRVLDALSQPFKTLVPPQNGAPAYYRIRRRWMGLASTQTQRLAWPRVGLFDQNNNPLDFQLLNITIAVAGVVTFTTNVPHNRVVGEQVLIANANADPTVNGDQIVASVPTSTTFTVTVANTTPGTAGQMFCIPLPLKWATAELAGQLANGDRTLDNDVIVQGITAVRAGSVSVNFKQNIVPQVLPDMVMNLLPIGWLSDELYVLANPAVFDVASQNPSFWWDRRFDEEFEGN